MISILVFDVNKLSSLLGLDFWYDEFLGSLLILLNKPKLAMLGR